MSNWISVKDKQKPSDQEDILLLIDDGEHKPYIMIGFYDKKDDSYIYESDPFHVDEATHWMKLPEMPKESKNGTSK